jgi:NitT/TauT family transport system substrate-binding protein
LTRLLPRVHPGARGRRANLVALTVCAATLVIGYACAPAATQTAPTQAPAAKTQAPAATAPAAAPAETTTVKVGVLPVISSGPLFIAMERGYLREYGIEVVTEVFDTGARMIPPLATGQLDVGSGAISAALFNAVAREIRLKAVALQAASTPGHGNIAMFVRKDLLDSGAFKDYPDMRGMKVAITTKGTSSEILLDRALQHGGLTMSDVEVVELTVTDMAAAFTTNNLDIGFINEPTATATSDKGFAVRWKGGDEIFPNQLFAAWFYSEQFASQRPDVATKFMAALLRGTRDFIDAFDHGKDKAAVVDILIKNTPVKDRPLYDRMVNAGMNPNGYIDLEMLEADQDWYAANGQVQTKVPVERLVDHSFVDKALEIIGKVQAEHGGAHAVARGQ